MRRFGFFLERNDLDSHTYGPDNVPRPPHHARPDRRAFAFGCIAVLGIIAACVAFLMVSGR